MSYDIGPRIGIEGEKQFKDVLSELNSRLKAFESELKATSSAFDKMDKSEENLTKQEVVKTAEDLSKAVLKAATDWVKDRQFYQESSAENELTIWK